MGCFVTQEIDFHHETSNVKFVKLAIFHKPKTVTNIFTKGLIPGLNRTKVMEYLQFNEIEAGTGRKNQPT